MTVPTAIRQLKVILAEVDVEKFLAHLHDSSRGMCPHPGGAKLRSFLDVSAGKATMIPSYDG